jgi:hypothetical protein
MRWIHLYTHIFLFKATPDASTTIATQVLFAFHMLFVNILLINLLIAMFSYVQKNEKFNQNNVE